jgi:hypothetical protein
MLGRSDSGPRVYSMIMFMRASVCACCNMHAQQLLMARKCKRSAPEHVFPHLQTRLLVNAVQDVHLGKRWRGRGVSKQGAHPVPDHAVDAQLARAGRVEEKGVHLYGAGCHGHGVVVEAQVLTNVAGLSLLSCCVVWGRVEP